MDKGSFFLRSEIFPKIRIMCSQDNHTSTVNPPMESNPPRALQPSPKHPELTSPLAEVNMVILTQGKGMLTHSKHL